MMPHHPPLPPAWVTILALLLGATSPAAAGKHPARGLWVGEVTLDAVTEVSVPFDEEGRERPPNPEQPTPTSDAAHLRLILHVDGSGQVRLLKEVALLNRSNNPDQELDLALVTDESLYPDFPSQAARRIASASLDFGDSQAVAAVQRLVDQAATLAAQAALNGNGRLANFESPDPADGLFESKVRQSVLEGIGPAINQITPGFDGLNSVVVQADVDAAYRRFLTQDFENTVDADNFLHLVDEAVAVAATTASAASGDAEMRADAARAALASNPVLIGGLTEAGILAQASFYRDARGTNAITEIREAAAAAAAAAAANGDDAPTVELATQTATHEAAARVSDLNSDYNTFLASSLLKAALEAAAYAAAHAAIEASDIRAAVEATPEVIAADARAESLKAAALFSPDIEDSRVGDALDRLLDTAVSTAAAEAAKNGDPDPANDVVESQIRVAVENAVAAEQEQIVPAAVPADAPGPAYTAYVTSSDYPDAAVTAADAAAEAARFQITDRKVTDPAELERQISLAVFDRLTSAFNEASLVRPHEILMSGTLDSGGTVSATVFLPANHPTNPFRHRRHPDHSRGLDITRIVELHLKDPQTDADSTLAQAGYGVQRLTGVYDEEIFGLHKPLGQPNKRLGLRVRGAFEINRISLIDHLNAQ